MSITTVRGRGRPRVSAEEATARKRELPRTYLEFDQLPDDHLVGRPVVKLVFGEISDSTYWRWIREGKLPRPHKIGPKTGRHTVGEVKRAKAALLEQL